MVHQSPSQETHCILLLQILKNEGKLQSVLFCNHPWIPERPTTFTLTMAPVPDTFVKYGEITDSEIMKDRHMHGSTQGFQHSGDPSFLGIMVEIKRTIPKGSSQSNDFKTKKIFIGGIPTTVSVVLEI
ncbi:hypothetical protein RIF29_27611 [Crotalaria pallida]|uniref:Uncharacterized protein n=1 Tax=Crotalaria pallida TaxID=3830 RepID=A0AAN9EPD2_CROPI